MADVVELTWVQVRASDSLGDRRLLLTLLETHNIKVDGEKIRSAWPQSAGEQPTARAIRERIVKIRSLTASPSKSPASHVNNGVKKEVSPQKKTPGKQRGRPRKTSVERDDEEAIGKSFTSQDTATTPCPSPRKKRAVAVKVEHFAESEASDAIDLDYSDDGDFVPKGGDDDDDEDEYKE
ncbi:hypothetical protein Dda_3021 [Drechslerella dactyloides]|uniref:Uncharacterized protein n=1 Tax=Drechslerella dactyloides TaxID=74499 RepID=A0AAD6J4Z4_DREDA|nr:hypothetical protein Dda_3021 [Drechslerella dactyloides]